MFTEKKIHNILIFITLVCLVASPALAGKPHVREGWLVGVSFGYSEGHIEAAGDPADDENIEALTGGATPQIRVGKMLSSAVALGLDYHGWMLERGEVPLKYRSSLQSVSLTATWYPGRGGTALDGFYVRGGGGFAWASLTEVQIDEEPQDHVPLEQEHGDRTDENGVAINLQLGYEWRISRSFAAGLGLGANYLSIGRDIYDSAYYFPVTLTGIWYLN
jgi:hypothetical protein